MSGILTDHVRLVPGHGTLVIAAAQEFDKMRSRLCRLLLAEDPFNRGKWQQLDVSGSDAHATHELLNVTVWYDMPRTPNLAVAHINPDLPWAEAHFQERVGGEAINPGVEHERWPYHAGKVELHQHGGRYDHNYMERMWPTDLEFEHYSRLNEMPFRGYRFPVGDLQDVVDQLSVDPMTRQAHLPIWFPEDTGATQGQRVPCTLGYTFMIDNDGFLHMTYHLRSCEVYRHFTNDVYMAVRLAQWVAAQLGGHIVVGQLTMQIANLHAFVGDRSHVEGMITS